MRNKTAILADMTSRFSPSQLPQGIVHSLISVGGTFFATGVSAVTVILISRFLGPTEFGIFSLVFAIVQIVTKLSDFGFNYAFQKFIPSASSDEERDFLLGQLTGLRVLLTIIILVSGLILSAPLGRLLNFPATWIFPLAMVLSLTGIVFDYLYAFLQSLEKFIPAAVLFITQSTLKLGVVVLLYAGVRSVEVVSAWYYIFPWFSIAPILWYSRRWIQLSFRFEWPKIAKTLPFVRHNALQVISVTVADNIDVLFVQMFLTTYLTGVYGGISRMAFFVAVLGMALGNVLNIRASRYTRKVDIDAFLKKGWIVAGGAMVGFVLSVLFARVGVFYTIGPEYVQAVPELIILFLSSFILIATVPLMAFFYSVDKPQYFSWSGVILIVTLILGDLLLIPQFGLMGAAVARLLARLAVAGFSLWYLRKVYRKQFASEEV